MSNKFDHLLRRLYIQDLFNGIPKREAQRRWIARAKQTKPARLVLIPASKNAYHKNIYLETTEKTKIANIQNNLPISVAVIELPPQPPIWIMLNFIQYLPNENLLFEINDNFNTGNRTLTTTILMHAPPPPLSIWIQVKFAKIGHKNRFMTLITSNISSDIISKPSMPPEPSEFYDSKTILMHPIPPLWVLLNIRTNANSTSMNKKIMHKSPSLTTIKEKTIPSPKVNDNYQFIGYIDLLNKVVGNEKKTHKRSKSSVKRIT